MNNLPRTGTERTEATAPWVRLLTPLLACLGLVPASLGADIPDYVIVETNNVQVGGKSVSLEYKWECSCIDGEIDWVSIDAVSPKFFGSLEIPADFYIESYPFFLSVGRLEDGLFSNHKSIAEVIFPACTVEVGDGICSNCTSLASVTLQDGLWALGRNPFYGSMIQSLALPRTLQFLDGNPVAGCANLTSLSVDEANSNFTVLDGLLLGEENTRLIACLPKSKEVTIPATVTSIDEDAFSGCRQLKQVTMLCDVPTAADAIFSDTPASLIVKVDNSVKTCWKDWIGKTWHGRNVADSTCDAERELKTDGTWYYHIVDGYAELWCTNGTGEHVCALVNQQTTGDLELPAAIGGCIVKSIAPLALSNLRGIKSVTFANDSSYENIGDFVFSNCTSLASVTIPDSVRRLGKAPFCGTALAALSIPASLTTLDGNPLVGCPLVTAITTDNTAFKAEDGLLYNAVQNTLLACVPNKTSATLPATVDTIAADAFAGCKSLTEVVFLGDEPQHVGSDVFGDTPATMVVKADTYLMSWGDPAPATWNGRTLVNVGGHYNDGSAIWSYTVDGDAATITSVSSATESPLTSVTFPSTIGRFTVKTIGANALANQIALTSVSIPSTYETIGDFVFSNCTSLASVTIPDSVRRLGKAPFCGTALAALSIPASLTTLDGNPLVGCPLVTAITTDNTAFKAEDGLLYNAVQNTLLACVPNKTSATLPATVDTIAADAFAGCKSLTEVVFLGDEPQHVGSDVFGDTPATMVVKADTYLMSWGDPAPATWNGRTLVNVGGHYNDGSAIWSYTVDGDAATITSVSSATESPLTAVTLPSSIGKYTVKTIGANALASQTALTSVSIPSTYETIGDFAFSNCTSLASVSLPDGIISLGKASFSGTKLKSLTIPYTVDEINGNPLVDCRYAQAIEVDAGNLSFTAADGLLFDRAKKTLLACVPSETDVTLPATLTTIAKDAFAGCTALKTVTALCEVPAADDAIFTDTPADLVVKADTSVLTSWASVGDTWKERKFADLYEPFYTDESGNIWNFAVNGQRATIVSVTLAKDTVQTSLAVPITIKGLSVTAIADGAFSKCKSVETVSLPDGILSLGKAPFSGTNLKSLAIPYTLETIDDNPLVGCRYAKAIEVADDNQSFTAADGLLFDKAKKTLLACVPSATDVTLPATLTTIAKDAFAGCRQLKTVTALCEVPAADDAIFADTPADLVVKADTAALPSWADVGGTWKGRKFDDLYVTTYTDGNGNTWEFTVNGQEATIVSVTLAEDIVQTALEVPAKIKGLSVTAIADGAVSKCKSVETVSLPDGILSLGKAPFSGTNLKSLQIPYTVEAIDGNPLVGCRYAKAIEVADENLSFSSSDGILFNKAKSTLLACVPSATEITLPETLETIANDAFSGCRSLKAVTALCDEPDADDAIFTDTPADLTVKANAYMLDWGDPNRTDWKGRKFENTGVPLPVGPQNFTDESGVEWTYTVRADQTIEIGTTQEAVPTTTAGDISIPETFAVAGYGDLPVVTIGAKAFNGCADITSLSIPSGVTSIQPGAFNGCSDLASFTVASGNTAYKASATTNALYTKDGKTLVKVPAKFQFKTVYTTTTASTAMTIEERHLTVNKSGKLSETITIITNGTPTTAKKQKTETSDPVPPPSALFNNVELVADYAFTDCGFVAAVKPEMTATTNNVGAVSGPDPEHYADTSYSLLTITKKVTTVTTTTTAEVPLPEIPSTVVCSRLAFAGSAWEDQVSVAALPALGTNPTSAQIATVLSPAADERLATNITKAEDYNAFSTWASSVKNSSGDLAGQDSVMGSETAWTAFALDLDVLPESTPTSEDVKIEEYSQVSGTSDFRLLLSIDDMKIGPNAVAERLKTVFDISGSSALNPSDFSPDKVDLVFETPVAGKVPVTAKPADSTATSFFIKAGLK